MLTDAALKCLKPREKDYKLADRDGMYVVVTTSGRLVFRLDYRLNGRRETLTIGRYGRDGISLAEAREECLRARKAVRAGISPAQEKQREKRRLQEANTFSQFAEHWFAEAPMADSTRAMRRSVYTRDMETPWRNRLLKEIRDADLRALCDKVKARGALATAVHVRDITKQIFGFAISRGERVENPANEVGPASIAPFVPRDRSLSPSEIRIMLRLLEQVPTLPTIRLGLKLILLTMVRKSELQDAVWDEVDFERAVWSIPKERMSGRVR
jgi:integrase